MRTYLTTLIFLILMGACTSANQEAAEEMPAIEHQIDHLIIAISNLDSGIAHFERMTGVRPVVGGEHPGRGTHNALVSLGGQTYLEIIAPRQNLDSSEFALSENLRIYQQLTPIGWAINTTDPAQSSEIVSALGFSVSELSSGGRIKPDGTELSWTTFGITDEVPAAPFFIKWGETSAHPATTSPTGVNISKITISVPYPDDLSKLLKGIGIDVEVSAGELSMSVEFSGPNGLVQFPDRE